MKRSAGLKAVAGNTSAPQHARLEASELDLAFDGLGITGLPNVNGLQY